MDAATLLLPQLGVTFGAPIPPCQRLLVAGGRAPADDWLRLAAGDRELWCIDHGLDCCHRIGLLPAHVFGDGDSASPAAWRWAEEHSVPMEHYPTAKDLTDTQMALSFAANQGDAFLLVTGCFGGRLDHLYSVLHSCASAALPCCLSDERETVVLLRGGESARLSRRGAKPRPHALSLLPMTPVCEGVSIDRVRWPLHEATLRQSLPYAVSNVPSDEAHAGEPITVSLASGILAVYLCWTER